VEDYYTTWSGLEDLAPGPLGRILKRYLDTRPTF